MAFRLKRVNRHHSFPHLLFTEGFFRPGECFNGQMVLQESQE